MSSVSTEEKRNHQDWVADLSPDEKVAYVMALPANEREEFLAQLPATQRQEISYLIMLNEKMVATHLISPPTTSDEPSTSSVPTRLASDKGGASIDIPASARPAAARPNSAPIQLMQIISSSSDGSEVVLFDPHEPHPDSRGTLGTDGYIYTFIDVLSGGQHRYRREKGRFEGYGTFAPPEPVKPQSFSEAEETAVSVFARERRVRKVAEYAETNPLSTGTYKQLAPSEIEDSCDQSAPLVEDSDSLKKHQVRGFKNSVGRFTVGKIADSASGLPLSGIYDTLSTAKSAVGLAPDSTKQGYEPIEGNKSVAEAKLVLAEYLGKKFLSKGASVGGGVAGGLLGASLGSVVPVVGTVVVGIVGSFVGGKATSKAADKVTSAGEQGNDVRFAIQVLHSEARKGDGEAVAALLDLGLSEDVVMAPDGWKAAARELGV